MVKYRHDRSQPSYFWAGDTQETSISGVPENPTCRPFIRCLSRTRPKTLSVFLSTCKWTEIWTEFLAGRHARYGATGGDTGDTGRHGATRGTRGDTGRHEEPRATGGDRGGRCPGRPSKPGARRLTQRLTQCLAGCPPIDRRFRVRNMYCS